MEHGQSLTFEETKAMLAEHRVKMHERMAEKFQSLTLASTAKEVFSYMALTPGGSAERPHEFLLLHEALWMKTPRAECHPAAGQAFWRWVSEEWSGFDRIPHRPYARQFKLWRSDWTPDCMGTKARAVYDALPATLQGFRGQDRATPVGLSWTTAREVAEKFARGMRFTNHQDPIVLTTTIAKADIAFADNERKEGEVVLFLAPKRRRTRIMSL